MALLKGPKKTQQKKEIPNAAPSGKKVPRQNEKKRKARYRKKKKHRETATNHPEKKKPRGGMQFRKKIREKHRQTGIGKGPSRRTGQ